MEADWEVEIGGDAPVIEAEWPGFIDLRVQPSRISEISEATTFLPLADLLLALNRESSRVCTSKCDVWEPDSSAFACYIDLLPRDRKVFSQWQQGEVFCREVVARLKSAELTHLNPERRACGPMESSPECNVALVIRQAIAGQTEGFGITAYLSAKAGCSTEAAAALAATMAAFVDALLSSALPAALVSNSDASPSTAFPLPAPPKLK
jgi:hypothetical protein